MFYDPFVRTLPVVLTAACAASLSWLQPAGRLTAAAPVLSEQAVAAPSVFIDVGAVDNDLRPVTNLRKENLRVAIDGQPRAVISLRYVFRGPGAATAAAVADPSRQAPAAAERSRTVLLAVDETSFAPGDEKAVVGTVARVLDDLGSADQAAVVRLPLRSQRIALAADPAARRGDLAAVAGRGATAFRTSTTAPGIAEARANPSVGTGTRGDPVEEVAVPEPRLEFPGEREADAAVRRIDLVPLLDGLRSLQGPKMLVLFRQAAGVGATDAAAGRVERQLSGVDRVLEAASRARTTIHLVTVGTQSRSASQADDEERAIAASSGGTVTTAKNAGDYRAFEELRGALLGGYLVEVEGRATDANGRPHAVNVQMARGKTKLRAPRFWVLRSDPVPPVVPASINATEAGAKPAAAAANVSKRAKAVDPALSVLVARAVEYLAAYVDAVGSLVAEEDYLQIVRQLRGGTMSRRLRSDLLLVKTEGEIGWTQYRDVFEVDGKPVRDREARVQKLFLENPAGAGRLAADISNESSRYNIGNLPRTVNFPTLPLALLGPGRLGTLSFDREGEDNVGGIRAARVAFEELGRPTLVRTASRTGDAPSSGKLWIDPSNGRILKTEISVDSGRAQMKATVVYRPAQETGLWFPAQMDETYMKGGEVIEGRAVYNNFRSFKVTIDTQIKK